jgi:glucose-6-phosphate isomerase
MEKRRPIDKQAGLISRSEAWKRLKTLAQQPPDLPTLFQENPNRGEKMMLHACNLDVDISKQRVNKEILDGLFALAKEAGLSKAITAMFHGEIVNLTENRPALHVACRAKPDEQIMVDGVNAVDNVHHVLNRMSDFTEKVQNGEWTGYTGKKIKTVVSIGIGGSNLGPEMAYHALRDYRTGDINVRFVSNVDPDDLNNALKDLDPETTLFVIASKTFTTAETMANAQIAREWILDHFKADPSAIAKHFVAVSANTEKVKEFGINPKNMFEIWDWVGGRFSLSSAVGLPVMLAIGPERFKEMLGGFYEIDKHFRSARLEENLPVIIALINIWNINFLGMQTQAIIPYNEHLELFPSHLQQLIMESLGKRCTADGIVVDFATGPNIMTGIGTNAQHSFLQSLHQGHPVPVDFIGVINPSNSSQVLKQKKLLASMLAQAKVLAQGQPSENPHRVLPGNRPSNIILAKELNPSTLGQLVALYEHIVFVMGTIWGINPFDQFGVEAGKQIAGELLPQIKDELTSKDPYVGKAIERIR